LRQQQVVLKAKLENWNFHPYSPFVCRNSIFGEFFLNMTTRKVQKANFYMSDTSMEM